MGIHVVLYQPEIPSNTGNIARTCAATNTQLHLIHPLGFSTEDKYLKRAGLDYWEFVKIHNHHTLDIFFEQTRGGKYYLISKFGQNRYSDVDLSNTDEDIYFIFGNETRGLPRELIEQHSDTCLRIPMTENVRFLNLSNTACMVVYEALRQQNFPSLA
ncbi:tRNA (uridine(34)/cytosine(34)/5-carboxymethylaminomethyluridine(34)-2'-O)-methyltransferase TrmL [Schinkia sp. CFF1]